MGAIGSRTVPGSDGVTMFSLMKNIMSLSSLLLVVSFALGGCASQTAEEGEEVSSDEVVVGVHENITPERLGYTPRVVLADLKAAGARCVGTHCVLNGQDWDCSGGGYCSNVAR